MPIISPTAISPHRAGINWSSYWATREPSALVLTVISDVRIDATWTDSAEEGADGYKVYISTDNATWTLNDTVAAGVQASSITGLTQATIYYVKVVAYKGTNESTGITSFQLTLATALTSAYTLWFKWDDLSTVTKDAGENISEIKEKNSGAISLLRVGAGYPTWTPSGIKTTNGSLAGQFTFAQPHEIYLSFMTPVYIANRYILDTYSSGAWRLKQSNTTSGEIIMEAGFAMTKAFPLNEFHVAYAALNGAWAGDFFGVDTDESSGNAGANSPDGITLGRVGSIFPNAVYREIVCRTVMSSESDRHAIRDYLIKRNAFFLD